MLMCDYQGRTLIERRKGSEKDKKNAERSCSNHPRQDRKKESTLSRERVSGCNFIYSRIYFASNFSDTARTGVISNAPFLSFFLLRIALQYAGVFSFYRSP
ncbi:unnamed protein product [Amoebophrya sp. A120]|nr:unnamed protein product [Amoebophrya sp. A120]|eukprot:GSA120T00016234001.1